MNDERLHALTWPSERLGDALIELGRAAGLARGGPNDLGVPPQTTDSAAIDPWIERAAVIMGLQSEPLRIPYVDLASRLEAAVPGLWRLPGGRVLVVVGRRRRAVAVVDSSLGVHWLDLSFIASVVRLHRQDSPGAHASAAALGGLSPAQADRVRAVLTRKRMGISLVHGGWSIGPDPGGSFWRLARREGVVRATSRVLVVHGAQYLLWLLAWVLVGRAAFRGVFDAGWFAAWALLLVTLAVLGMLNRWMQGSLALRWGSLVKERLLAGALRLSASEIRKEGSGQLLGRVLEAQVVESLALGGGVAALTALLELLVTCGVLALGAGGWLLAPLLLAWMAWAARVEWKYIRARRSWTDQRVSLTHELVEKMVGHRTRSIQDPLATQGDEDDRRLADYLRTSKNVDAHGARLATVIPRGWVLLAMVGLAPTLVWGDVSGVSLAISIGGIVLASRAFATLAQGASHLAAAWIAWENVRPLFRAAQRRPVAGAPGYGFFPLPGSAAEATAGGEVLEVSRVDFSYRDRSEPVLKQCSLTIARGDRVLLEGASGSGKSTLAAVMQGRHRVDGGLVLLRGRDRFTLGDANWRQLVATVPQFHENHLFTETLAFNLLMGRRWPPTVADLAEAERVCHELGLAPVLHRMPAGIMQMVGDKGWQLSHGERSRVFLARALLQQTELLILDETFAALDPSTLERTFRSVLARAPTLVLVAHP